MAKIIEAAGARFTQQSTVPMLLKSIVFCLSLVFSVSQLSAAEITQRPDLAPRLAQLKPLYPGKGSAGSVVNELQGTIFLISGVIEKGDLEKLKAALDGTWGKFIVFDSPGGSFLEGIRIGQYLQYNVGSQDPDLNGVFVLNGNECLSACALAFTLAATPRNAVYGGDIRFLEAGAALGYHMAFLPEEKANQLVAVKEAMNLAYEVTQTYVKLIKGGIAPSILLQEALSHRTADSFFYLAGGIRSYAMGLTPVSAGTIADPINKSALYMDTVGAMCTQLFQADNSIRKSEVEYEFGAIDGSGPNPQETKLEDLIQQLGSRRIAASHNGVAYCTVELSEDGTVGMRITSGSLPCAKGGYDAPTWCAMPGPFDDTLPKVTNALLADAASCHGGTLTTEYAYWTSDVIDYDIGEETPTVLTDWNSWERTIARDVNVRQNPSLDAEAVGRVQIGDKVKISDCRIVSGPQGVWYQLSTGGWISARFVSEFDQFTRPATEETMIGR
ncbi:SH3 domain-containing protein [Labrenzia sp. 5N]|uniref:SH3 domain-containing protein n=1 Tax=Labrenzia sp. 5N TaxID=2723402 RepID=UPI0014474C0B|nr:SH3 domain-containing protein [Labrenzia sp. 5N]NKX65191.1 SH3 domain-containing protein [Labrenzia sp. 5N]